MSEYVPEVESVRFAYVDRRSFEAQIVKDYEMTDERAEAEFDRWLASVKEQAWDEGGAVIERYYIGDGPEPVNPYREEATP